MMTLEEMRVEMRCLRHAEVITAEEFTAWWTDSVRVELDFDKYVKRVEEDGR